MGNLSLSWSRRTASNRSTGRVTTFRMSVACSPLAGTWLSCSIMATQLRSGSRMQAKTGHGGRHRFKRPPRFPGRREFSQTESPDSGIQQLGQNRYMVSRAKLNYDLNNLGSLITQIRAEPNLENGSTRGFRLSQIQPGSVFEQIGLENGDIITGAQDREVRDAIGAMALVSALRNSPSISLNIIRNGTPLKIDYTIR